MGLHNRDGHVRLFTCVGMCDMHIRMSYVVDVLTQSLCTALRCRQMLSRDVTCMIFGVML